MSGPELEKVDPSLALQRDFARIAKGTTAHIKKMRQDIIYTDGVLPTKIKILGALLWSISARCEPCVAGYAEQARKYEVTEEELGEFLALASTMGGCVGETWALKAYKAFKESFTSKDQAENQDCCH